MISCSHQNRKRDIAMPASTSVRTTWRALPVITGDVRPEFLGGQLAATVARFATPGHHAWSPPI